MQCFQGKSVYKGIAMGPVVVLKKNDYQVKRTRIEDAETKLLRSSFRNSTTKRLKKSEKPARQSSKYIR